MSGHPVAVYSGPIWRNEPTLWKLFKVAMDELVEFRVDEAFASRLFASSEGKRLGESIRKVAISVKDPRFHRIGDLQREIAATTKFAFFYGWDIQRRYSKEELLAAQLFSLSIVGGFEPPGELCGTVYDESTACPDCGAGATQISELRLDLRRAPRNKDIARTIADEWIVSQHLAERMTGLTGFELRSVRHFARYEEDPIDLSTLSTGRELMRMAAADGASHPSWQFDVWLNRAANRPLLDQARAEYADLRREAERPEKKSVAPWYQLVVNSSVAEVAPPTRAGFNPFDDDRKGECRCPRGDTIGLNLLSEVSVSAASRGDCDIVCSRQYVGVRRGLLRPRHIILISPKVRNLFEAERVKGAKIEVAHLV